MNNQTICVSGKYFEKPAEFLPERWLKHSQDVIPRYAFMPFGFGSRMCIGRRFAEQEIYLALIKVSGLLHKLPLCNSIHIFEICEQNIPKDILAKIPSVGK